MKKVISTIISVVIMLCLSLTAFAEPELQTPSDDDISVCYLYTDKISGQSPTRLQLVNPLYVVFQVQLLKSL